MVDKIAQVDVPEGVINLGVGQPALDILPLELIRTAAQSRLIEPDPALLNYGALAGGTQYLRALAQFLSSEYGMPVDPDSLFTTTGASRALDLSCQLLSCLGDTIIVEEPSYFLALDIFRQHGLNIVGAPIDDEGLVIDELRRLVETHRPALIYTIPSFQNPTGLTLSAERREQLAELAAETGVVVLADEVYQMLAYSGPPPPSPMAKFINRAPVISIGSFSKILAPGLRLGWIQAGPELLAKFTTAGVVVSGGGLNPLAAEIVRVALASGAQKQYLAFLRGHYANCVGAMDEALHRHFEGRAQWKRPGGGFFFWLELKHGVAATRLIDAAQKMKTGFQPGPRFSSGGAFQNALRLSFAYYNPDQIAEGVERLAGAIARES